MATCHCTTTIRSVLRQEIETIIDSIAPAASSPSKGPVGRDDILESGRDLLEERNDPSVLDKVVCLNNVDLGELRSDISKVMTRLVDRLKALEPRRPHADLLRPTPFSTLPPEVLDLIIKSCFQHQSYREKIGRLALVCRAWTAPVQRVLFRSVGLYYGGMSSWEEFAREKAAFGRQVQLFSVNLDDPSSPGRTSKELNALIDALPNLVSLTLNFGYWKGLGDFEGFQTLQRLTEVKLEWFSLVSDWPKIRQILSGTPNIKSLALGPYSSGGFALPTDPTPLQPLSLPSLTRLSLSGLQLCKLFDQTHLLCGATLRQVTRLELSSYDDFHTARRLPRSTMMDTFGEGITSLQLTSMNKNETLSGCHNLQTLIMAEETTGLDLPSSVKTFVYRVGSHGDCEWMKAGYVNWRNVKRIEVEGGVIPSEELILIMRGRGIDVVV